jgi:hypothetical protein
MYFQTDLSGKTPTCGDNYTEQPIGIQNAQSRVLTGTMGNTICSQHRCTVAKQWTLMLCPHYAKMLTGCSGEFRHLQKVTLPEQYDWCASQPNRQLLETNDAQVPKDPNEHLVLIWICRRMGATVLYGTTAPLGNNSADYI